MAKQIIPAWIHANMLSGMARRASILDMICGQSLLYKKLLKTTTPLPFVTVKKNEKEGFSQ